MLDKDFLWKIIDEMPAQDADSILRSFVNAGKMSMSDYSQIKEDMTRKEILKNHKAAISQHKDGRWRTYVPTPSGKPKLKVRTTREKLEDDIVEAYKAIQQAQKQGITFEECYWRWREVHDLKISNNTIAKYDTDYKRYFEGEAFSERPIADITEEEVERFIFSKMEVLHLCREAVKSFLCYIKNVFRSAKKNRDITEDVTKDIQRSEFFCKCVEVERPLDAVLIPDADWKLLYDRLQDDLNENSLYFPPYAILLAALTGMRVGELSVLKWSDIRTDPISGRTYIGICRSETYDVKTKQYDIRDVKNHRSRVYPVSTQIHQLLLRIQTVQRDSGIESEWIFYHENFGHIHKRQISDCLKNRCKEIGIRPKGTHAFRRQINSDMRCDGVSEVITSSLIGNSTAVNEKHYTFDVSGLEEKERIVERTNEKRLAISNSLANPSLQLFQNC
ncbi:MAG: site-specific integrase [Eubacteriales bacterium]|nr:site-specific integrase [Eubacteriales bacterium]